MRCDKERNRVPISLTLLAVASVGLLTGCSKQQSPGASAVNGDTVSVSDNAPILAAPRVEGADASGAASPVVAASTPSLSRLDGFNAYVLEAVAALDSGWGARGYDLKGFYTHTLPYFDSTIRPSASEPKTMCVAAVSEVIIAALQRFGQREGGTSVPQHLPARTWSRGTPRDLRTYIFMFEGSGSLGTANALQTFGIGREVPFSDLLPGDFVNLNRTSGSGHAVVFISYIDREFSTVNYGESVAGFEYFSAQGNSANGGLGYRWAFFEGYCPAKRANKPRDCGVLRSDDQRILNTGYMLHPAHWRTDEALGAIEGRAMRRAFEEEMDRPYDPEAEMRLPQRQRIQQRTATLLNTELTPVVPEAYNGQTTDD
jgi:hypothetical protein